MTQYDHLYTIRFNLLRVSQRCEQCLHGDGLRQLRELKDVDNSLHQILSCYQEVQSVVDKIDRTIPRSCYIIGMMTQCDDKLRQQIILIEDSLLEIVRHCRAEAIRIVSHITV